MAGAGSSPSTAISTRRCASCGSCAIRTTYPVTLVNSVNPYRIEGQKTGAFEICDDLGRAPDYQSIPVGNAGNITAYWKGYKEYAAARRSRDCRRCSDSRRKARPRSVLGHPVEEPHTLATAIKIGNPASWKSDRGARDESGGLIASVTDDEILAAYRMLGARKAFLPSRPPRRRSQG